MLLFILFLSVPFSNYNNKQIIKYLRQSFQQDLKLSLIMTLINFVTKIKIKDFQYLTVYLGLYTNKNQESLFVEHLD